MAKTKGTAKTQRSGKNAAGKEKPAAVSSATRDKHEQFDIVIVGAGVVGLAGAMYAGRMNMKTLIIGDVPIGGTITLTDIVENYPGFKRLTGLELADKIKEHALDYPITFEEDKVVKIERCVAQTDADGVKMLCFTVFTDGGKIFHSKTVLFATGTKHRELGVPGEDTFKNRGIHSCALCDGAFYRSKMIGVVGGSDSAAKEALVLTQWAKKVYMIYRGDKIRPEPVNMKRVEQKIKEGKMEIIYKTNVKEIKGDSAVRSVILDKPYNGKTEFPLDALFVEIGLIPLSEMAKSIGVEINEKGEIKIDRNAETNVPGFYAAGDVADTRFKQAITGVAEAVLAVYSAYTYVNENEIVCPTDANGK